MKKLAISTLLLATSVTSQASIILQDGESYSASFNMESTPSFVKLTDNYWEVFVGLVDSANTPGSYNGSGSVTLTLFENQDQTSEVFTLTDDSSNWMADYGLPFWGNSALFSDLDGSFTITYNGAGTAELFDVNIYNYAGILAPSNIATATIIPTASPVPLPGAAWLMLSGLGLLGLARKKRV